MFSLLFWLLFDDDDQSINQSNQSIWDIHFFWNEFCFVFLFLRNPIMTTTTTKNVQFGYFRFLFLSMIRTKATKNELEFWRREKNWKFNYLFDCYRLPTSSSFDKFLKTELNRFMCVCVFVFLHFYFYPKQQQKKNNFSQFTSVSQVEKSYRKKQRKKKLDLKI